MDNIPRKGSAKFHTWFISVRPQDGISNDRINLLKNWIEKQPFYHCITEGSGASLHLHFCIAFPTARIRSNVINAVLNLKGMDFTDEEAKAFRTRNYKGRPNPSIWYNWDVCNEYLVKDSCLKTVCSKLPPAVDREEWGKLWFPAPDDKSAERGPTTNAEWRRYKKLYDEEDLPPGVKMTEQWFIGWFNRLMNQDKMRLCCDQKLLRDKVRRFMDYVYDEARDHYVGSSAKRLKTMEEEDANWDQKDRQLNPHNYIDSEDQHILDMYLTRPH